MKLSVVGIGAVGTAILAGLVHMAEINEIVAVNRNHDRAAGEIIDLRHIAAFPAAYSPTLTVGDYEDTVGSGIVVIAVGAQPLPGGSREDVLVKNCNMIREVIRNIEQFAPGAIVLVVTNPVDIVAHIALDHSGFPRERLLSTGTVIDSARLMQALGAHAGIDPKSVFGFVVGDHSETGFIPWSICNIGGVPIERFCISNGLAPPDKSAIRDAVNRAGYEIFRKKGNTNHGIAAAVCRIVRAIIKDERAVLPVGALLQGEYGVDNLVMSVPCVIGRNGIEKVLAYDFSASEKEEFARSENHVRSLLALVAPGEANRRCLSPA